MGQIFAIIHLRFRDVRRSEGCPYSCTTPCTVQAAFLVSAHFARRSPLGGHASSVRIPVKRILPIAAAPAALAGLAAAFTLGNGHAAPAVADAAVNHPAATAATAPKAGTSTAQLLSFTRPSAAGVPVVRLDATQLAQPKGKHHRTAKYTVRSGDTLASIAQHLYHGADYWPVLFEANKGSVKYANDITVGQVLTVPAKPAKVPSAPEQLAPAAAPVTSTASSGESSSYAGTAETAPAQSQSVSTAGDGSFQSCVIASESGGNAQVTNGSGHYGLYQFSASTWAEYGGNPAEFGDATAAEQNQVFNNAIAAGGQSNWSAYDGC
jgi:LysM repeat protein